MRLLIAWGVLIVGALISIFLLPLLVDFWVSSSDVPRDEPLDAGAVFAMSLEQPLKLVAQWCIPFFLLIVGLRGTYTYMAQRKK